MMRDKPIEMAVTFTCLEDVVAWIDYAKSMRFKPRSVTLSLQDMVFGVPTEPNAQIDAMVAKAAQAIEAVTPIQLGQPIALTADDMRKLFGECTARKGKEFVLATMCKHGGSRLNEIAETAWPALAAELRDA